MFEFIRVEYLLNNVYVLIKGTLDDSVWYIIETVK